MTSRLATAFGVARSLRIYYGNRERRRRMDAMHRRFVSAGDLAFDIGAHVGDRIASLRKLGARVVAVEPQPALAGLLRLLYGRDPDVILVDKAVGRSEGTVALRLNPANPTVATASPAFIRSAGGAPGWEAQRWTESIEVPMTTLDQLVAWHGAPAFVKIDIEGFEAEALRGLTRPVPALSFEFTTIQKGAAREALAILSALGPYRFNAALGETHRFVHPAPLSAEEMACWVENLPMAANSGDVYACLREDPIRS